MREDYIGEESIPEIDDSDQHISENNEETVNAKETTEIEEPKKKSLRDDDFSDFATTKAAVEKEKNKNSIVWHTSDEPEAEKIDESENLKEKTENSELNSYEIKCNNYDEEKKKKKEKKSPEEAEEKKEKTVIDRFMLLDFFFSFVENEQDINGTLTGYFAKVFQSFFNKKQKEVLILSKKLFYYLIFRFYFILI